MTSPKHDPEIEVKIWTPEDQISFVLDNLLDVIEGPAMPGDDKKRFVYSAVRTLDAMWKAYRRGEMKSIPSPFSPHPVTDRVYEVLQWDDPTS